MPTLATRSNTSKSAPARLPQQSRHRRAILLDLHNGHHRHDPNMGECVFRKPDARVERMWMS
jgi:hypothetical protein